MYNFVLGLKIIDGLCMNIYRDGLYRMWLH